MAAINGSAQRMLALIRERGAITSGELCEALGIRQSNIPGLLARHIDAGVIVADWVRLTAGGRPRRRYTWQAGAVPPAPTFARVNESPKPHERGMRTCLGRLCEGKRKFLSAHAGNRLCPRCTLAAEQAASRCGLFDTPHVVLNT